MDKLEELSRDFEVSVPAGLYGEPSLPSGCVKLFCIIKQLQHPRTKFCTATNETLGDYANASVKTVKKHLKLLREAGFLSVKLEVKGDGTERKFYRFLHASNDRIDTCRDIVRVFEQQRRKLEDYNGDFSKC